MKKINKGILIAVEGIDGSGKSTLAARIAAELKQNDFPVLLTKEPGSTPLGQKLRTLVQEKEVAIGAQAEFLLFAADRAQHFNTVVLPALADATIVISDRMADSSLVYQGYGRGLSIPVIETVNSWVMHSVKPDITVYVKVPVAIAFERIAQRNQKLTAFEKENRSFFETLSAGFEAIYKNRSDVIIIDGTQPLESVVATTLEKLLAWISATNLFHNQH